MATGMLLVLIQAAAVTAVGYLLMPAVLSHYGGEAVVAARLYLLWAPLTLTAGVGVEVLRGRLALSAYNFIRVLVVAGSLAGLLMLIRIGQFTVIPIVRVYLVANLTALATTLVLLKHYGSLGLKARRGLVKPMLAYGLKSHIGNISVLTNTRADQALIALFLAPVSLGLYSVAITLTAPVNLVGTSIALVAMPAVSACGSTLEMKKSFGRFVRVALALSLVVVLCLGLTTPLLIPLVFGHPFLGATSSTRLLLVAALFTSTNQVLAAGLSGSSVLHLRPRSPTRPRQPAWLLMRRKDWGYRLLALFQLSPT
jgi:O-antigen/teichoic acid export membrane protein